MIVACQGWRQKRRGREDNGKTKVDRKNEQVSIEDEDKESGYTDLGVQEGVHFLGDHCV